MADPEKFAPTHDDGWHLEPASRWRGLDQDRDGVKYNPQKLAGLAETLNAELAKLSGVTSGSGGRPQILMNAPHGSSTDLSVNADLSVMTESIRGIKNWPGGHELANALDKAHTDLTDTQTKIIETAQTVIELINNGAGKYGDTNLANGGASGAT